MKAIDLYSGVGGWALGFKIAGIEVVKSFEWWEPAAKTEEMNLGVTVGKIDIRSLDVRDLPNDIDIVIGSPPCTQFSYSNRGGSGDIADGLKDISKFLEAVAFLKPKFWAMENVPRVRKVLESELTETGQLKDFIHLREEMEIEVLDASDFGLPQRRKRCIAGSFPLKLLRTYTTRCRTTSLGEAVEGFGNERILDMNFGSTILRTELFDHVPEPPFDDEELRINRESKERHPVYNGMRFPDPWDEPVRTVTATCSRVSRESVVIRDPGEAEAYRRLSVRERATVQGFPLTYQFFGSSYASKAKMVGNAIPPVLTYYLACAMKGIRARDLKLLHEKAYKHPLPRELPQETKTDTVGKTYPRTRTFRFAIPHLRFKSGTRFDLANSFVGDQTLWNVEFYYGPSKDIREIRLDDELFNRLRGANWFGTFDECFGESLDALARTVSLWDGSSLQERWTNKSSNSIHPHVLLDHLGDSAEEMISRFPNTLEEEAADTVLQIAADNAPDKKALSERKLRQYAPQIFCGLVLGAFYNSRLPLAA